MSEIKFVDEHPRHRGKVWCSEYGSIVRNHHNAGTGVVTWGRFAPCKAKHYRLQIVKITENQMPNLDF